MSNVTSYGDDNNVDVEPAFDIAPARVENVEFQAAVAQRGILACAINQFSIRKYIENQLGNESY